MGWEGWGGGQGVGDVGVCVAWGPGVGVGEWWGILCPYFSSSAKKTPSPAQLPKFIPTTAL